MRRLLDDQGRLFGIINLADLVLSGLLIAGGVVAISSYRILTAPQHPGGPWELSDAIEVACVFDRVEDTVSSKIQVGDVYHDSTGRVLAEILEAFAPQPSTALADFSSIQYIPIVPGKPLKRVVTRLRLHGQLSRDDGKFYFQGRPVTNGSSIDFRSAQYGLSGTVRPGLPREAFVLLRGNIASMDLAGFFNRGDAIYDHRGEVVGQVIDGKISVANPRLSWIPLEQKGFFQLPLTVSVPQVELWVRLVGWERGGHVIFDDKLLKVGASLMLRSLRYDFSGDILEIRETPPAETVVVAPEPAWRYIRVRIPEFEPDALNLITPNDPIYDARMVPVGEVVQFLLVPPVPFLPSVDIEVNPERFLQVRPTSSTIQLWVKLHCFSKGTWLFFSGEPLKVGSSLSLRSDEYDLDVVVLEIRETPPQQTATVPRKEVVQLVAEEIPEPLAKAVKADDLLFGGGQVIGRIARVTDLGPAEVYRLVQRSGDPYLVRRVDLHRLQVTAELQIDKEAIRIGDLLTLISSRYTLQGTVVEIEEGVAQKTDE